MVSSTPEMSGVGHSLLIRKNKFEEAFVRNTECCAESPLSVCIHFMRFAGREGGDGIESKWMELPWVYGAEGRFISALEKGRRHPATV